MMNSSPSLRTRAAAELERRRRRATVAPYAPPTDQFTEATFIENVQDAGAVSMPFKLWQAQRDVLHWMDTERLLVILKARQLGVSWLACAKVLHDCVTLPNQTWLLFSQGKFEANELIRRIGFLDAHHTERSRFPALVSAQISALTWANGSRVMSLPATKRAGRSFTASGVVMDEYAHMEWGADLLAAVKPTIDGGGKLFIISSADGNGTDYHQTWQMAETGDNHYKAIFLPWTANETRTADWRDQRLAESKDASTVLREYPENAIEAFTHAAGLIYGEVWRDGPEDGNVQEEAADYVPDGGPIFYAVDDGYVGTIDPTTGHYTAQSHPRVFLFCQQRPTGQLCVFAESYAVGLMDDQHIEQVLGEPYPAPDFVAIDKSAAQLRGRFQAAGMYTRNGPGDVDESIKELRRWIAPDKNNVRRLLVHPRCKQMRFEFSSYRYDDHEKPVKAHDHSIDAIRYLCWNLRHE